MAAALAVSLGDDWGMTAKGRSGMIRERPADRRPLAAKNLFGAVNKTGHGDPSFCRLDTIMATAKSPFVESANKVKATVDLMNKAMLQMELQRKQFEGHVKKLDAALKMAADSTDKAAMKTFADLANKAGPMLDLFNKAQKNLETSRKILLTKTAKLQILAKK